MSAEKFDIYKFFVLKHVFLDFNRQLYKYILFRL